MTRDTKRKKSQIGIVWRRKCKRRRKWKGEDNKGVHLAH